MFSRNETVGGTKGVDESSAHFRFVLRLCVPHPERDFCGEWQKRGQKVNSIVIITTAIHSVPVWRSW